ncbi:transglutaminase-like domain-containing protein [Thermopirellula anaerolimosa]
MAGLLAMALAAMSCRPGNPLAVGTPDRSNAANPASETPPQAELWYMQSVFGRHVGYEHQSIEPISTPEGTLWRIQGENRLTINRSGTTIDIVMKYRSTETPSGELQDFELDMIQGPLQTRQRGRRENDQLLLEIETAGRPVNTTVPIPPHCGGMLGIQADLWRRPMQPGEERTLSLFLPGLNEVGEARLAAEDWESVTTPDGPIRLLRIRVTNKIGSAPPLNSVLWCDASGLVRRQRLEALNLVSELTDKDRAMADPTAMLDLVDDIRIPVKPAPENLASARTAVYRVIFPGSGIEIPSFTDSRQSARLLDDHTVEIEVQARRVREAATRNCGETATDEDRNPNAYIQSDAPEIRDMAEAAIAEARADSPRLEIAAMEAYVHRAMVNRNYRNAFGTALDAARKLEGDCTEHAVLLAALARARGFPARVAMGLLYHEGAFYYHMWTEVWLEGCWIPLDATLGSGGVGVGHITLTRSSLGSSAAFTDFLPLMQVIGRIKIEVVRVE